MSTHTVHYALAGRTACGMKGAMSDHPADVTCGRCHRSLMRAQAEHSLPLALSEPVEQDPEGHVRWTELVGRTRVFLREFAAARGIDFDREATAGQMVDTILEVFGNQHDRQSIKDLAARAEATRRRHDTAVPANHRT